MGCSQQTCCCEGEFCCKSGMEQLTCGIFAIRCCESFKILKSQQQCCCCVEAVSCPPDDEVPCMFGECGLICNKGGSCIAPVPCATLENIGGGGGGGGGGDAT